MARQTKPLSAKEIDAAKPKQSDYVLYDGDGLELLVKFNGSKLFNLVNKKIQNNTALSCRSIRP